jgi:caffeoyl-CoA O-methyltransferase
MPPIQVNRDEGKLLELLLRLVGARRVVELGTLAGYSAIRIARALPEDGKLWTIDCEAHHAAVARENIAAAGFSDRVEVLVGVAVGVLETLVADGPFDAVFIDADKENYDVYGRWAASHLRVGGLLVADNTLYFGRLLDEREPAAAAMRRFHREAAARFDTAHITTADGQLLGVKR